MPGVYDHRNIMSSLEKKHGRFKIIKIAGAFLRFIAISAVLLSTAHTLCMDDVFSSIDARPFKRIYEWADPVDGDISSYDIYQSTCALFPGDVSEALSIDELAFDGYGFFGYAGAKPRIIPDYDAAGFMLNAINPLFSIIGGESVPADAYGGGRETRNANAAQVAFPEIQSYSGMLGEFSSEVAQTHRAILDRRAEAVSYARQLAAAKFLAQNAYRVELAASKAFVEKHGKSAADMSEGEISKLYGNDYFMNRLRELGFFRSDAYGADVNRRNAIIRAQSSFNIPITARIDLNTKRALIEGSDYVPKDILECEHSNGMWVTIDKSARILTVYVDDKAIMKYPVAVGSSITLTPEGKFSFVVKAVNPRWGGGGYAEPIAGGAPNNPLGKRWMGLSVGGGGSYGVHGNVSPYSIGTNASHGCIRMINSDVEYLYDFIEVGTPVWIGTTSKLREWGIYQLLGCWEPDPPDYFDYLPRQTMYEE